ncbi:chloride channel 3/4/5, partial [Phenoliferia sp. Uapishka_3]
MYAPYAFHTGIPEIKTILGGYIITDFLSGWTLLIKSLGLPLAVASGLSLGKEGPIVHVACCIGNLMLRPFKILRQNEARQREILAAAAAAGVSVAFGAPLGGVLFSLEEVSTFFPGSTLWQSFVCAIVAGKFPPFLGIYRTSLNLIVSFTAVTLQYIDPFNTGKLVLFQVTTSQVLRGFELIPWALLGVVGGLWGAWFIHLNKGWERFRRQSGLNRWPVTEVALLALFTAVVSYLVVFMRIPTSELVVNLFQDCSSVDTYGLCDPTKSTTIILLLLVSAFSKTLLTAVTFGASLPAGIFLPSLVIGACFGRAVGIVMASIQHAHPGAWLFADCPADGACISPPVYAVVGAASALGGATRMTVSLVVIIFELTGAVDLVLQVMMAVMISKFTADFFTKSGIYETWINIRNYPFLNNKIDYRNDAIIAKDVMTPTSNIASLTDEGWTFSRIEGLLQSEEYRGFPILRTAADKMVLGYISRLELESALAKNREFGDVYAETPCYFTANTLRGPQVGSPSSNEMSNPTRRTRVLAPGFEDERQSSVEEVRWVNLQPWVDETPICVNPETPMEVVVQMFQRLGLRSVLFTRRGALTGIVTKMDIHAHMQPHPDEVERRIRPGPRRPSVRPSVPTRRHPLPPPEEMGLLDNSSVASGRPSLAWDD